MKRTLSILLVLLLALSLLPAGAMAADVVLSPQNLRVNGKRIACEKYNIDGANYFKLRDIAMVLNETGSRFSVGWDGEKKVISVVTGEEYEPNGSELDLSGGDKSATAAVSTQTLLINGVERGDLSAYNIGGNNFFKLRDLGDALGFRVDYDKESNTAIVIGRAATEPALWRTEETFITSNTGRNEHFITTYDGSGRVLNSFWDYGGYTEQYDYTYNELGYETQNSYRYYSAYDGESWENTHTTTSEYDKWGLLVKQVTVFGGTDLTEGDPTEETYAYNDEGQRIRRESKSQYGLSVYEYTYEDGRLATETFQYEDYRSFTTYTYDDRGNLVNSHSDTSDWDRDTTCTYDEEGRILSSVYYNGADLFTTCYAYDAEGRLLQEEYDSPDEEYVITYTYDAQGNLLTETCEGSTYKSRTEYSYDAAEGKKTAVTVVEYPGAEELVLDDGELTLAVGDVKFLNWYFLPAGAPEENVSWSSSNDSVVAVDGYGSITAKKAGKAVVTATSESGLTASCEVTVAEEKYELTLKPTKLKIKVDETAVVCCTVEVVGIWKEFKGLSFTGYDDELVFAYWDEQWSAPGVINLNVIGLEVGMTTISVYVRDEYNQKAGRTEIIQITVTEDESSEKP
jgi:hypothetical protein